MRQPVPSDLPTGTPAELDVTPLISAFARLDGIVEMPSSRRFIVITVLIRAGFPAVEAEAAACGGQVRARASSTCAAPVSVVSRPQ